MKRNNIFMWAYISFIMVSALLRLFVEFSLWTPIVLAITISSVFFAFEDLFSSLYHSLKGNLDIANSFLIEVKKGYDRDVKLVEDIDQMISPYKDPPYEALSDDTDKRLKKGLQELKEQFQKLKESFQGLKEQICSFEKNMEKKGREINKYRKAANVLSFLGFLCLFCTLIVATPFTIPRIVQEILTVVPFALILITQQVKGILAEKNKEDLDESRSILGLQTQRNEAIVSVKERLESVITSLKRECKEIHNAS